MRSHSGCVGKDDLEGIGTESVLGLDGFCSGLTRGDLRTTANHRDSARADQFDDAIAIDSFDESLDLVGSAADFDHHFPFADIDDLTAEDIDQFANFAADATSGSGDFDQQEIAFDVIVGADIQHTHNRDDFLELFADLVEDLVVADNDKRHSRKRWIFRFTDSQRINVVTAGSEHSGNVCKHSGHVLNERREQMTLVGTGHENACESPCESKKDRQSRRRRDKYNGRVAIKSDA